MAELNILLAEDDPAHRELLHSALCGADARVFVTPVAGAGQFRDALAARQYDCAVLDYHLGGVQAEALLRRLRATQPDCPAVVVSSSGAQDVAVSSFREGSADFLTKFEALEQGRLWTTIRRVVHGRRRLEHARRMRERREVRLRTRSDTDALTGLANRRAFGQLVERRGRRTYDRRGTTSLVLFDLDHFKGYNDTYGHAAGDRILTTAADMLRVRFGHAAGVFRWGGEEFLVLLPGVPLADAVFYAEWYRRALAARRIELGERCVRVTASGGVVCVPSGEVGERVVAAADAALYAAKGKGRNRIVTWPRVALEEGLLAQGGASPVARLEGWLAGAGRAGPVQRALVDVHGRRVAALGRMLAEELGLGREESRCVEEAARLSELGKLCVPEDVLARRGPLGSHERALLGRHALDGAEIAQACGAARETSEAIRRHHCGTAGAHGECMSRPAQVVSVANVIAAMTAPRPYRAGLPVSAALRTVRGMSGLRVSDAVARAAVRRLSRDEGRVRALIREWVGGPAGASA